MRLIRKPLVGIVLIFLSMFLLFFNTLLIDFEKYLNPSASDNALPADEPSAPSAPSAPWGWRGTAAPDAPDATRGMSACLLLRDDNDRLPEWLAYHYHVLPLLHLVIAVDPESTEDPRRVLDRWRGSGLDVAVWDEETRYLPEPLSASDCRHEDPEIRARRCFVPRQTYFFQECLRHLRRKGRKWVLTFDSDEFVVFNAHHANEFRTIRTEKFRLYHDPKRNNDTETKLIQKTRLERMPRAGGNATVLEFIERQRRDGVAPWDGPCVSIPRLRFGPTESDPSKVYEGTHGTDAEQNLERTGVDPGKLDTLRFRIHARRGRHTFVPPGQTKIYRPNNNGKALVDLSRTSEESLQNVPSSPHSPTEDCKNIGSEGLSYSGSLLRIQHYSGSKERYFGKVNDTRRTDWKFDRDLYFDLEDDDIRPWYKDFVDAAGIHRTKLLLNDGNNEQ
mmetsp:Transcript_29533/g.67900  ORF Transcript_29533/g.67900 Transcript_29533/m.67900 type:complete len:447 (-) Transcript_29533:478-1818(-)